MNGEEEESRFMEERLADIQQELTTGSALSLGLSCVSILANGAVLIAIWKSSVLHSQPNYLLGNLAAGDLLLAFGYLEFTLWNLLNDHRPSRLQCISTLLLILWAVYISICSIVPIAHYRVKLVKAYSKSLGKSRNITETWKFVASISTLWIGSLCGALFSFVNNISSETPLPVCVLPVAVRRAYLVSFFLFTSTISVMVTTEYIRLIIFVAYGSKFFSGAVDTTDKWHKLVQFDPRVTQVVIIMAGSFVSCWLPFHFSVLYYLHPFDPPTTVEEKFQSYSYTYWIALLPLVNATINPFIYSLSDHEFRESLWSIFRDWALRHNWPLKPPQNGTPSKSVTRRSNRLSEDYYMPNTSSMSVPTSENDLRRALPHSGTNSTTDLSNGGIVNSRSGYHGAGADKGTLRSSNSTLTASWRLSNKQRRRGMVYVEPTTADATGSGRLQRGQGMTYGNQSRTPATSETTKQQGKVFTISADVPMAEFPVGSSNKNVLGGRLPRYRRRSSIRSSSLRRQKKKSSSSSSTSNNQNDRKGEVNQALDVNDEFYRHHNLHNHEYQSKEEQSRREQEMDEDNCWTGGRLATKSYYLGRGISSTYYVNQAFDSDGHVSC